MPFDPVHLILAVSAILGFYAFQISGRRRMLGFKICSDATYGLYILLLGGYAGAMCAFIAFLGGLTQVVTPPHLVRKTMPYRFVIACILSVTGAYFLSKNITDIYPFLGVIIARFTELFQSTLIIRSGYFIASSLWVVYSYSYGFHLALAMSLLMMFAMVSGHLKNERRLPKDPVP